MFINCIKMIPIKLRLKINFRKLVTLIMKAILNRLIQQDTLNKEEAKSILVNISKGEYNSSQIASFLTKILVIMKV